MDAKTGEMSGNCPLDGNAGCARCSAAPTATGGPRCWRPTSSIQRRVPNPMGDDFDYAEAFKALDYEALKADLTALMTDSQPWWPADYGHYGPFFIRMAWHAAGTYRTADGRGGANSGQQRFAPLNSLARQRQPRQGAPPAVADQAEVRPEHQLGRPVHPRRQRRDRGHGRAGVRLRRRPRRRVRARARHLLGRGGQVGQRGRADPHRPEHGMHELEGPLAAIQMGLIYVNPEGPGGNPDPLQSARDIKDTFERMAMNHEETVALTAGGHTFGKAHGNGDPSMLGAAPAGGDLAAQGFGWVSQNESGIGEHTVTSGHRRLVGQHADAVERELLPPAARLRIRAGRARPPARSSGSRSTRRKRTWRRRRWDPTSKVPTMMTTADMALKMDPEFRAISEKFRNDHEAFKDAFARAWFKLTHRDMGPKVRYLGPEVPAEDLIWQDPVPAGTMPSDADVAAVKAKIADERPHRQPADQDRLGLGLDLPQVRPSRRRQRRAHRASRRRRTGRSTSRRCSPRCSTRSTACAATCRWPTRSCSAAWSALEKAARDAGFNVGAVHRRARRRDGGADRRRQLRGDGARGRRASATTRQEEAGGEDRGNDARPRQPARPVGARDGGAGRRPARARRQPRRARPRPPHQALGPADQRLLRQPARHDQRVEGGRRLGRRGIRRHRPRRTAARPGARPAPT